MSDLVMIRFPSVSVQYEIFMKTQITKWQRTGRVYLAGAIALAIGVIIWITSLPPIRRNHFQFFYSVHHLYVAFILFFLLHAGDSHFYLVFSGVLLFALDKILRIIQSRQETRVISARLLPCKAVELTLPKHPNLKYTPTSTIFMKMPSISKFEWHPFSITSSSNMDDDKLSVLVKCQGSWTKSLYDTIQSMQGAASHMKSLNVAVEGPYGPATFPDQRYDSLLLIAGGSGITPILSILQDTASRNGKMNTNATKMQLIYAVKKSEDLSMLSPISALLLNRQDEVGHLKVKLFVTQEEGCDTSLREILHETSEPETVISDPSFSGDGVPRPMGLLWKAAITGLASIIFLGFLVLLSHAFVHQEKKSSGNKNPSWINDLLVVCSLFIAVSCSTAVITLLARWRNSVNYVEIPAVSQKHNKSAQVHSATVQGSIEEHEISFGQRPNLAEVLQELYIEAGGSKVGVFVCGPDSMQETVALFCRTFSGKYGKKRKCLFMFHSINFSL